MSGTRNAAVGVILLIAIFPSAARPEERQPPVSGAPEIEFQERMGIFERQLQETRRDQLNYKIERDLLKETYSSNLQTVNVVITLILGTFSVLGFLGVRSIGATRQEFSDELNQLRDIRSKSETRLAEIESRQQLAQTQLAEVSRFSVEQDQRVKLLEIQERAASLVQQKAHQRALDYIAVGLDSNPDDLTLLGLKRTCVLFLNRFDEAREVLERIVVLDSENKIAATDLCEIYLIQGMRDQYDAIAAHCSSRIQSHPYLAWYFRAIRLYQDSDAQGIRDHMASLIAMLPPEKEVHTTWRFTEFIHSISDDPPTEEKHLLIKTLEVLVENAEPGEVKAMLEEPAAQ